MRLNSSYCQYKLKLRALTNNTTPLSLAHVQYHPYHSASTLRPAQEKMFSLIKTEFIESKINHTTPYTYSDRRFYQVLNFDVRLSNIKDMAQLSIIFPKELGDVYVTYTQSNNQEIHPGETWQYKTL